MGECAEWGWLHFEKSDVCFDSVNKYGGAWIQATMYDECDSLVMLMCKYFSIFFVFVACIIFYLLNKNSSIGSVPRMEPAAVTSVTAESSLTKSLVAFPSGLVFS